MLVAAFISMLARVMRYGHSLVNVALEEQPKSPEHGWQICN